jgi:poly-beta-hydroxybutyrate-responsive repressor
VGVLPRNYLQGCLLLLLAESPSHGYDLMERLSGLGLSGVDSGGLYRALRSLDEDGLVESWHEESQMGPVRRRYRISDAGVGGLETWAATVGASASSLNSFLHRHRQLQEW